MKFELQTDSLSNTYAVYIYTGRQASCSIRHVYSEKINTELNIYTRDCFNLTKEQLLEEFCSQIGLSEKIVYTWSPNCYWYYYKFEYDWDKHKIFAAPILEEERLKRLDERFEDISVDDLEKIYLRRVRCI